MKKFLTITCAAVAVSSLALGLAACGDKDKDSKVSAMKTMNAVYMKYTDKAVTKAEGIEALKGYESADAYYGNFYRFEKEDASGAVTDIALYNIETGAVLTFNDKDDVANAISNDWTFQRFGHDDIVRATLTHTEAGAPEKNYVKYFFYANGEKFAESSYAGSSESVSTKGETLVAIRIAKASGEADKFYFDEDLKQVEYDEESKYFENTLSYTKKGEGENSSLYYDSEEKKYVSYNKDLEVLYTYDLPSAASINAEIVFDSGNYLIQYQVAQAMDAGKYDILSSSGYKYNVETVFVNVEKKKVKNLNFKFVLNIDSSYGEYMTPGILEDLEEKTGMSYNQTEGIDAYFRGIGEIGKDKRVSWKYKNVWFGITEEGKLKKGAAIVEDMDVVSAIENADGNLEVVDDSGRNYVVSKEGEIIKEYNETAIKTASGDKSNDKYTQIGDDLYDNNFKKVYTVEDNYIVDTWLDTAVILKETVAPAEVGGEYTYKYYVFNGEKTLIADTANEEDLSLITYTEGYGSDAVEKVALVIVMKDDVNESGDYVYSCTYYNASGAKVEAINNQMYVSEVVVAKNEKGSLFVTYRVADKDRNITEEGVLKLD